MTTAGKTDADKLNDIANSMESLAGELRTESLRLRTSLAEAEKENASLIALRKIDAEGLMLKDKEIASWKARNEEAQGWSLEHLARAETARRDALMEVNAECVKEAEGYKRLGYTQKAFALFNFSADIRALAEKESK